MNRSKIKYPHTNYNWRSRIPVLNDTYAEHVDAYFKGLSEQDIPNYMIALRDGLSFQLYTYKKNIHVQLRMVSLILQEVLQPMNIMTQPFP